MAPGMANTVPPADTGESSQDYVHFSQDRQVPYHYDVELNRMMDLKTLHSVELHVVLYPYSKLISSADYSINPFEEYARDISGHLRSSYVAIASPAANIFGLILGAVIAAIFYHLAPDKLVSVESTVSILGAYAIGKELYGDLDSALVRLTKSLPIRFLGHYYAYRMDRDATMTSYSALARARRHGKETLAPEMFDFIEMSNSVTVRMMFTAADLAKFHGSTSAHVLSVHMDQRVNEEFISKGFMLGIKLSLNERYFGGLKSRELFQSLDGPRKGCLVKGTQWVDGVVCSRTTYSLGRVKYFARAETLPGVSIVSPRV